MGTAPSTEDPEGYSRMTRHALENLCAGRHIQFSLDLKGRQRQKLIDALIQYDREKEREGARLHREMILGTDYGGSSSGVTVAGPGPEGQTSLEAPSAGYVPPGGASWHVIGTGEQLTTLTEMYGSVLPEEMPVERRSCCGCGRKEGDEVVLV